MSSTVALRTALIWHDEVMSDVVVEKPRKITLGKTGKSTFVVPDVGLPAGFAIVRPGNRGYLLTLGQRMRGTICLDGEEQDVETFIRKGGGESQGGFRATPISGRDWGVIELDETGTVKLFFQFVPFEEAPVFLTPKVLAGGVSGLLLAGAAGSWVWNYFGNQNLEEAAFRGFGLAMLAVGIAAMVLWFLKQDNESKASYAFSVALHGALLGTTFMLYSGEDPFAWPGPRSMTGNYLVTRLEPEEPPEPAKTSTVGKVQQDSGPKNDSKEKKPTATKGDEGKSGGEGIERARLKDSKDDTNAPPPQTMLFTKSNRATLDLIRTNTPTGLAKFMKDDYTKDGDAGEGKGTGSGVGDELLGKGTRTDSKGDGAGGGGKVAGDFKSTGKPSLGKERQGGDCVGEGCKGSGPKEVKVAIASGTGDFGGYTEDEINRVVKARAGVFRACYQKELNRSPGLGGKLVVRFKIGSDGAVQTAANAGGSSLTNDAVESCVKSNVMRLKFPPKGAIANVTYPFVFSQGG
ncbi:MAG: AgmX/PglI C-terminal domain-containing protein [Myxococcota bacterium]|nr:AgmX/PglI C-terminal domain-containing protein [Deltaproteobacteria bacterium]MDQ3334745.1 AgmX/PglI C-terminal domain-containing protein [Myxococcota bacterium]